jgi:hypothetical protein
VKRYLRDAFLNFLMFWSIIVGSVIFAALAVAERLAARWERRSNGR